jgi:DGQHR domain-containing protein
MMNDYFILDFIEINQPIGTFYITKMKWKDLLEIAEADIRRIEQENIGSSGFDSYLGIQRDISPKRVKDIGDYVTTIDATFPTSIILSVQSKSYELEGESVNIYDYDRIDDTNSTIKEFDNIKIEDRKLLLRKSKSIASILDGQHRIEGLKAGFLKAQPNNDNTENFELNITIFVDLDIDDQAQIFSVINKAQTKVNKSLVYDLYEYSRSRSPQKTAHDIVRILNRKESSPFYKKIKILGKAVDKDKETIAQATFVELIINYISLDPMKDRDLIKRKKNLKQNYDPNRYIFRDFFINGKDELILFALWNYFKAISNRWAKAWNINEKGNILNKSTGLVALMRLYRDVYSHFGSNIETPQKEYLKLFEGVNLKDDDFNPINYLPGSSGQSKLYRDLKEQLNL